MTYLQIAATGAVANILLGIGRFSAWNLALGLLLAGVLVCMYMQDADGGDHATAARDRARQKRKAARS